MGRSVGLTKDRADILKTANATPLLVTINPSYILRIPDHDDRVEETCRLVDDLRLAKDDRAADKT